MSIQVTGRWWSGLNRALAVLGVLVGVFAMHCLTGNHDVMMASPQMGAASSAAEHETVAQHVISWGQGSSPAMASADVGGMRLRFEPVGKHQHAMGGACLAMLTALVLLLVLALALRSLLAWRSVQVELAAERPVLTGRSPPWLTPSLSKLCVSRT
jgi:hypothetical protein